jgi:hypothetical protein
MHTQKIPHPTLDFPCLPRLVSRVFLAAVALFTAALPHARAAAPGGTGASINETNLVRTIYADPVLGADGANYDGSSTNPVLTLSRAYAIADSHNATNPGSIKIIARSGTYPEAINLTYPDRPTDAFILEAATPGQAIVSAFIPFTGWTSQGDGTWTRAWPYSWSYTAYQEYDGVKWFTYPEALIRRESLVVDDQHYLQVLSSAALVASSYFVDTAAGLIRLKPPAAIDPNTRVVELAAREWGAYAYRSSSLRSTPANLVFRGMVFRGGSRQPSSGIGLGAVFAIQNGNQILIDNCRFLLGKKIGLSVIDSDNITIRDGDSRDQGITGVNLNGTNFLVENFTATNNAFLATRAGLTDWAPGGFKAGGLSASTLTGLDISANDQRGAWFDTLCHHVLVSDSLFSDNLGTGFFWELNHGQSAGYQPIPGLGSELTLLLRDSVIEDNIGRGFSVAESENIRLERVLLRRNSLGQFAVSDGLARATLGSVALVNSTLVSSGDQPLFAWPGGADTSWSRLLSGLTADTDGNSYQHPATAIPFRNHRGQPTLDLAGWRALLDLYLGGDNTSTFTGEPVVGSWSQGGAFNDGLSGNSISGNAVYGNDTGDTIRFNNVSFPSATARFTLNVANPSALGTDSARRLELRLGSPTGTLIGTHVILGTGDWGTYQDQVTYLTGLPAGTTHSLFLVCTGGSGAGNFQRFGLAFTQSWISQDIGSPGVAGTTAFVPSTGVFTIEGGGTDIWGGSDKFRYVRATGGLVGDGEIVCRVNSVENTDPWAKAGLMIRETTAANSRHATLFISYGGRAALQSRATAGGATVSTSQAAAAPRWIRLVRSGNTFTGYHGADGVNWSLVGSVTIAMTANVQVGLAVTAHNNATLCTTVIDNVTLTR